VVRIVTASRRGCVHIASQVRGEWVSEGLDLCWPDDDKEALSVLPLPQLQALLIIRRQAVDLVDSGTRTILHTFAEVRSQPNTVRCFHTVRRHPQRGWTGIASFSLIYNERDSETCALRTYTPEENEPIPIGSNASPGEPGSWDRTFEQFHRVESPGKWVALPTGIVVGVRKREITRPSSHDSTPNNLDLPLSGLRRRVSPLSQSPILLGPEEEDIWEAWMLSAKGETMTTPLCPDKGSSADARHDRYLLATNCGPVAQAGQRSVAVGLGDVIKVVTVGNERFADEDPTGMAPLLVGRRRRLAVSQRVIHGASSS
jgi:hypothetical protein